MFGYWQIGTVINRNKLSFQKTLRCRDLMKFSPMHFLNPLLLGFPLKNKLSPYWTLLSPPRLGNYLRRILQAKFMWEVFKQKSALLMSSISSEWSTSSSLQFGNLFSFSVDHFLAEHSSTLTLVSSTYNTNEWNNMSTWIVKLKDLDLDLYNEIIILNLKLKKLYNASSSIHRRSI